MYAISLVLSLAGLSLALCSLAMSNSISGSNRRNEKAEKEYYKLHKLANRKDVHTLDDLLEIINRNK